MYRAVIVDLDRTLLRTDKTISEYSVQVLRGLRERGVLLFVATARPERAITEYLEQVDFQAWTTLNGARTITPSEVFEDAIAGDSAAGILAQLDAIDGAVISLETDDGIYSNVDIPLWEPKVVDDMIAVASVHRVYKIIVSHPSIPLDKLPVEMPSDVYCSVADGKLMQVMSAEATKWNGINEMLGAFGISPSEAVYFGDDNDDVEPIRLCGRGVAVSNALDCVKAVADAVAGSNDEDGVARYLEEMWD
ncbi:MAG: HAD family hydrolase [Lachnospiraceae bacterium]|nr:HAD family hydrolase [Lachnospiraceae bacterium]